jgi:hypothetical protein
VWARPVQAAGTWSHYARGDHLRPPETRRRRFINVLLSYDSAASHADPHLRDVAWNRENAVLALGTAVSLAQLIFADP